MKKHVLSLQDRIKSSGEGLGMGQGFRAALGPAETH